MTKIPFHTDLDIEQLISQLDINTLEAFAREIEVAIVNRKQQDKERKEKKLLQELNIHCVLPIASWERFQQLIAIRETGQLSESEQAELQELILEEEQLRLKRIKILGALSKLKNVPLLRLMKQMDIQTN